MQTTPQQVQGYLQDTLRFFRAHMGSLTLLALPYALASELLQMFVLSSAKGSELVAQSLLAELIIYPIFQSALIVFIGSTINGQNRSFSQCYTLSAPYWPRMLLLTLITTLGVMGGFSLFILPGLFLMVRLALSDMYCMIENRPVVESIRLSVQGSQPVSWVIFLGLAMLFPAITLASIALSQTAVSVGNPLFTFVISLMQALLNTLYSIYLFRVYSDLRQNA